MAEAQAKRKRLSRNENDNLSIFEYLFGEENSGEEFVGFEFTSSVDEYPEIDDIQWNKGCTD